MGIRLGPPLPTGPAESPPDIAAHVAETTTAHGGIVADSDSRLSDARTPLAHATSHKSGGSDAIKLDELAATTDVATLNASTSAHGLLPKLSNVVGEFLNGQGAFSVPPAGGVSDGDKGDITVSASGATWTIDPAAVTLAKQADMATASVLYRKTAGTGVPEVNTLATLKTDLLLTGTNSGDQTSIVGITGTIAQFNTALSDGDFATGGGTATGANTGDQTTVSGNAGTATALQTARDINGVSFNGTANITVTAAGSTLTGTTLAAALIGTAGTQAAAGNDARLSDARTPNTHNITHKSGGSDAIKLDEFAAPTDITTLNATTGQHGLMPKGTGSTATFFRSDMTQASVTAVASISQTEIDFGTTPVSENLFTITDANVSPSSKLIGSMSYEAPTSKDLDELDMDDLVLRFGPGTGQFSLYVRAADGSYLADKFKINYQVGV